MIFLASPLCASALTRNPTTSIRGTVERGTARLHHAENPGALETNGFGVLNPTRERRAPSSLDRLTLRLLLSV